MTELTRTRTEALRATFHPQAWQNNYAIPVDPKGPTSWLVTAEYAATLPDGWEEPDQYESDALRYDPAAPTWVAGWDGPFWVEVEWVAAKEGSA
jgi:hypothetical protein